MSLVLAGGSAMQVAGLPGDPTGKPAEPVRTVKTNALKVGGVGARSSDDPGDGVEFTPPDRGLMKTYHTAQTLVKRQRDGDAVEYLGKLLKRRKIALCRKRNGSTYHGLKSEVIN